MGNLQWHEEAKCTQLYEGLSEEIKNELVHCPDAGNSLAGYIEHYKNIDNRLSV